MSNKTPNNFEYHWPRQVYLNVPELNNWFLNFETNTIYIASMREEYSFVFTDDLNNIIFGGDYPRATLADIRETYLSYLAEKALLE